MRKVFQVVYGILLSIAIAITVTVVVADPAQLDDLTQVLNNTFHEVENFAITSFLALGNLSIFASSVAERMGVTLSPKYDFGAKFDAVGLADGTISVGSKSFSSVSANFTSADVGKVIDVDFAGPSCGPLHTTIAGFLDVHDVTLADAATCTVGYNYVYQWIVATPQSGSGSYAPGDTVTLSISPAIVPAVALVTSTQVASVAIVAGGTGGVTAFNSGNGTCYVETTTGTGIPAVIALTLTSGIATSVGTVTIPSGIVSSGEFSVNLTTLTAEPVLSGFQGSNCTGLTGATLSIKMGPLALQPTNHAAMGQFAASPPITPTATTTSGSGTGLLVTPIPLRAGNFVYGTDDTTAWQAAFTASNTLNLQGKYNCIVMPGAASLITAALPVWTTGACIQGQARNKSILYVSAAASGNIINIDNAWVATVQNTPNDGSVIPFSIIPYGTSLDKFSIIGNRHSLNVQNALIFSDHNDFIHMDDIFINGFNGTCWGMGSLLNDTSAYTRESNFYNIQMEYCGSSTADAFYLRSSVAGNSADLHFHNINLYAPFGTGAHIFADGTANVLLTTFDGLRVEGLQYQAEPIHGDLLVLGDAVNTGRVNGVKIHDAILLSPYPGQYTIRLDASATNRAPFNNEIVGDIGGGLPYGGGILINYGFTNTFRFNAMNTIDNNVVFGANAGGQNDISGPGCSERGWTYSVGASGIGPVSRVCYYASTTNPGSGAISYSGGDLTLPGGRTPPTNSVNLSSTRITPWQVPLGFNSVSIGSADGSSTGNSAVDIGSLTPNLTGSYSTAIGAFQPKDKGWPTSSILSGFGYVQPGGQQLQHTLLACRTAATNSATCTLTSDGTGTPSTTNVANPGLNTAQAQSLTCVAHDSTNNTNSMAWFGVNALLMKQLTAGSTQIAVGSVPTPLTLGTTTGASLAAPAADTTNAGMSLVFTAPSTNSAIWTAECWNPALQND